MPRPNNAEGKRRLRHYDSQHVENSHRAFQRPSHLQHRLHNPLLVRQCLPLVSVSKLPGLLVALFPLVALSAP